MKLKGILLCYGGEIIHLISFDTNEWNYKVMAIGKKPNYTLISIIIIVIVINEVVTPTPCAMCEQRCASNLIPQREILPIKPY